MYIDKNVYVTILCQTLSPCGKYLVVGDIYGYISVFEIDKVINSNDSEKTSEYRKPKIRFESKQNQVCSLVTTDKFLIAGCICEILGFDWKTLTNSTASSKAPKAAWKIEVATDKLKQDDISAMIYDKDQDILFAGCGDNNIYLFNLETGKSIRTMAGHEDYIHDLSNECNVLLSASEDGYVKIWDMREKMYTNKLAPYTKEKLNRYLGKWVGAVSIYDNWAVCGGGPRASLWHLRSLQSTTIYNTNDNGIHVIDYYEGNGILIGGAMKQMCQFTLSGDLVADIPISSPTAYTTCIQLNPKLLTIAGSSPNIDVCTSFTYRDQIISIV